MGIRYIIFVLKRVKVFLEGLSLKKTPPYLRELVDHLNNFIEKEEIVLLINEVDLSKREVNVNMSISQIFQYDEIFRLKYKEEFAIFLNIVYEFDALLAIASAVKKHNLSYPVYLGSNGVRIEIRELFHPFIKHPVKNDFDFKESNFCLLTGSNMTGKSTFLKSIGSSLYLAHIGFPVPAKEFKTSLFDGIYTTINLADNIHLGYSHFFNEVRRVKETVTKLQRKGKYFIIFDELFRGTNLRDAYEASMLIIKALAKIKTSLFVISTHLIELALELEEEEKISFLFLESAVENNKPKFYYKLKKGISRDRLGIVIVKNEGIVELLEDIQND